MPPDQKKIVLVVDNEQSLRKLVRLLLERAGYTVLLAGNSNEALVVSRGCSEHIDLLFSDVEMPGMNGIALAHQIAAERPGIAVLLNSANPSYMTESQFAFLAKPFSPAKLQSAIAQTLERQPQAVAQVELEAGPAPVMEGSYSRPEISIPDLHTVETGTWVRQQSPSAMAADLAGWHTWKVMPESEGKLPEAAVLARADERNVPKLNWSTMRTTVRNFAISAGERVSRWRLAHGVPVWATAFAVLVLAIAPFSLHQINEGLSAKPYAVSLQSERGLAGEAKAPTGKPLLLHLDLTSLPRSDSYKIQIVNGDGDRLWQKVVLAQGSEIHTNTAALRTGTYFVRVYGTSGELLKEYELRVTETH